jgi:D-alanyl-D-alanine dipeptidase
VFKNKIPIMLVRHENRVNFLFYTLFNVITFTHPAYSNVFNPFQQPFRPLVIDNVASYQNSIGTDSSKCLVRLNSVIPQLVIDLKYSTESNFTGKELYRNADAFARLPLANALKKINAKLFKIGLGLKIFDAYRPYSVTKKLWKLVHDERYAANPAKGSGHNRGVAVDVTLVRLSTGQELEMPTGFDDFSERAHHDFMNLPKEVLDNRKLLKQTMEEYGLVALSTEWWHYSLPGPVTGYELLDLDFTELDRLQPH